jgi:hypothetical protein
MAILRQLSGVDCADRRHLYNHEHGPNCESGELEYIHLNMRRSLTQEDDTDDGRSRSVVRFEPPYEIGCATVSFL